MTLSTASTCWHLNKSEKIKNKNKQINGNNKKGKRSLYDRDLSGIQRNKEH
jgi:hypothetical protein